MSTPGENIRQLDSSKEDGAYKVAFYWIAHPAHHQLSYCGPQVTGITPPGTMGSNPHITHTGGGCLTIKLTASLA